MRRMVEHPEQHAETRSSASFGRVGLRKLFWREARNRFARVIEGCLNVGDHVLFAQRLGLGWIHLLTGEHAQKIAQILRQVDHLLGKAHLRGSEFEIVVFGGHRLRHFQREVARRFEMFQDRCLTIVLRADRDDDGAREQQKQRDFVHSHLWDKSTRKRDGKPESPRYHQDDCGHIVSEDKAQ